MDLGKSFPDKVSRQRGVQGWPSKLPDTLLQVRVDTREKAPWDFTSLTESVLTHVDTLTVGDYALQIEGKSPKWAAVERKSKEDFIKCVGADRARFFKQISLLRGSGDRPLLIIEADLTGLETGDWRGMITPDQALSTLHAAMQIVPVVLARTRREAERSCYRHLRLAAQDKYREAREFARIIQAD